MPHQSLLYAGRVHACANLPQMMPNPLANCAAGKSE
jgi:hypothetical protein